MRVDLIAVVVNDYEPDIEFSTGALSARRGTVAWPVNHSADAALANGAADGATAAFREALDLASAVGDRLQQVRAHQGLADVQRRSGQGLAAARHEAAADQLFAALGITVPR